MSKYKSTKVSPEQLEEAYDQLKKMSKNMLYKTEETYAANEDKYPSHSRTFVQKHIEYLRTHPNVNCSHYIANLKLACKIR